MEFEIGEIIVNEELEINDIQLDIIKQYPELEDLEVTPSSVEQNFSHPNSYGYDKVKVKEVSADELNIAPTIESQQYIGLYGEVNVSAVTSDIDNNIKPNNIKQNVEILGVTGNVIELKGETRTITPTTNQQTITPSADKNGITEVIVDAVTSNIDSDIKSKNIKKGVDILGITGEYAGAQKLEEGVNFIDYDGVIIDSYSIEEALMLTNLPSLPDEKDGLIAQEWNWELEDIKRYLQTYGGLVEVGCIRTTKDGKTKIYISLGKGQHTVRLNFYQNVSNGVIVNWGDSSADQTYSGNYVNQTHIYNVTDDYKEYMITLKPIETQIRLGSNSSTPIIRIEDNSANILKKIYIGDSCIQINSYCFYNCSSLEKISIPSSLEWILNYSFSNCNSLSNINIPKNALSTSLYAFAYSDVGQMILPSTLTGIQSNFLSNSRIKRLIIPDSVTNIQSNAFESCLFKEMIIPDSVTNIGSGIFKYCSTLVKVRLSNNLKAIPSQMFNSCTVLQSIKVPKTVTSIGSSSFANCYNLTNVDFTTFESVPTLGNSNAFSSTDSNLQILVPSALETEWKGSTNWSTYADKIIGV